MEDYYQIEKLLSYLDQNKTRQPSLEELSAQAGLSPFYLQKIFKRWVGISPKRFLQFLTIDHAKSLLQDSRSVLQASFESGLSGPGRMHDLFVSLEAVTPGEFKSGGDQMVIESGIHDSPFGACCVSVTEKGICGLTFHANNNSREGFDDIQRRWPNANIKINQQKTAPILKTIFGTKRQESEQPLTLLIKGTNFQIKVWEALINIPSGQLVTYHDIASFIGQPGSSRAVGNAVGANPISYLIPCHRVIKKMGIIGNYHWGPSRKKAILGWEAARKYSEIA